MIWHYESVHGLINWLISNGFFGVHARHPALIEQQPTHA